MKLRAPFLATRRHRSPSARLGKENVTFHGVAVSHFSRSHAAAVASPAASSTRSSGSRTPPYRCPSRSRSIETISASWLPSGNGDNSFPLDNPAVPAPKDRVSGRPLNATATASPELAVRGPVRTATGTADMSRVVEPMTGNGVTRPSACSKAPAGDAPNKGRNAASMGCMLPPLSPRRSTGGKAGSPRPGRAS
jgi:hypothetical protein